MKSSRIAGIIMAAVISILMLSSSLEITDKNIVSGASIPSGSSSNLVDGNLTLFSQNYTTLGAIPDNVFISNYSDYPINATLSFKSGGICLNSTVHGRYGKMYLAGLSPVGNSSYHVNLSLSRENADTQFYVILGMTQVVILDEGYQIRFACAGLPSKYFSIPPNAYVELSIDTYSYNRTNHIYANGFDGVWVSFSDPDNVAVVYSVPPPEYATIRIVLYTSTWAEINIHKMEQTTPQRMITIYAPNDEQAFGYDGPHALNTVENGWALLQSHSYRATIYADILYMNPGIIAEVQTLLDLGWELGIHYSQALRGLSLVDAKALMLSEYNTIAATFDTNPVIWCSSGNSHNVTHANFAFNTLDMVSRYYPQGWSLDFNDIAWEYIWKESLNASFCSWTYTHETDLEPSIIYSIDWSKFVQWVDSYVDAGIKIVPAGEWYLTAANTIDAYIPNIVNTGEVSFELLGTNNYPTWLRINDTVVFPGTQNNVVSSAGFSVGKYVGGNHKSGLRVSPNIGTVNISMSSWNPSAETVASWNCVASGGAVTFTLSGLESGVGYKVYVDGHEIMRQHDGLTTLTFTYDGPWSSHTFEVKVWDPYQSWEDIAQIMWFIGIIFGMSAILIQIGRRARG